VARYHNTDSIGSYIPNDFGRAVAVHEDPETGKVFVYVTGHSFGATQVGGSATRDYATVKYDGETGTELWHARYDAGPDDGTYPRAIAVDEEGNVYVTGWSVRSGTGWDAATVKYDKDGNELWVARYNGPGNAPDEGVDIAVDKNRNVYVTGWSVGSGTGHDFATIKYDGATGTQLWIDRYDLGIYDGGERIAVDSAGNVYVTGPCWDILYDYATMKYDTNGNRLWVDIYNGPGNSNDYATDIAVDSCGNVYVTGRSMGIGTGFDYATVMYDSAGNRVCVACYDAGPNDRAIDIALDLAGNVYVTGQSYGSGTNNDYATLKYGPNPKIQIVNLICKVENIVNIGVLKQQQGKGLIAKLNEALKNLNKAKPNKRVACNKLSDFIDQVNAYINSGILTPIQGQALIDAANDIINELCG